MPQNAGDPVVVGIAYGGTGSTSQKTVSSISDDGSGGGSTWKLSSCPGATCAQGYVSAHSTDMGYTLSAAAGMGHITVNVAGFSGSAVPWQIYAVELRPSYPPAFLDTSGSVDHSSSTTTWAGVALSPTGNDFIVQILHSNIGVNAVTTNPSGTNYSSNVSYVGAAIAAYSINTSVGTAPTFGTYSFGTLFCLDNGDVAFSRRERGLGSVYRMKPDGSSRLQKVLSSQVLGVDWISPDGNWLAALLRTSDSNAPVAIYNLHDGTEKQICDYCTVMWSPEGKRLYISFALVTKEESTKHGQTYILPWKGAATLQAFPSGGTHTEAEVAKLAAVVSAARQAEQFAPGLSPDVYAYSRRTIQRNLYRVQLR